MRYLIHPALQEYLPLLKDHLPLIIQGGEENWANECSSLLWGNIGLWGQNKNNKLGPSCAKPWSRFGILRLWLTSAITLNCFKSVCYQLGLEIKGCSKTGLWKSLYLNCFPLKNIVESWYMLPLKGVIHCSAWRTKHFSTMSGSWDISNTISKLYKVKCYFCKPNTKIS